MINGEAREWVGGAMWHVYCVYSQLNRRGRARAVACWLCSPQANSKISLRQRHKVSVDSSKQITNFSFFLFFYKKQGNKKTTRGRWSYARYRIPNPRCILQLLEWTAPTCNHIARIFGLIFLDSPYCTPSPSYFLTYSFKYYINFCLLKVVSNNISRYCFVKIILVVTIFAPTDIL